MLTLFSSLKLVCISEINEGYYWHRHIPASSSITHHVTDVHFSPQSVNSVRIPITCVICSQTLTLTQWHPLLFGSDRVLNSLRYNTFSCILFGHIHRQRVVLSNDLMQQFRNAREGRKSRVFRLSQVISTSIAYIAAILCHEVTFLHVRLYTSPSHKNHHF